MSFLPTRWDMSCYTPLAKVKETLRDTRRGRAFWRLSTDCSSRDCCASVKCRQEEWPQSWNFWKTTVKCWKRHQRFWQWATESLFSPTTWGKRKLTRTDSTGCIVTSVSSILWWVLSEYAMWKRIPPTWRLPRNLPNCTMSCVPTTISAATATYTTWTSSSPDCCSASSLKTRGYLRKGCLRLPSWDIRRTTAAICRTISTSRSTWWTFRSAAGTFQK